MIKNPYVWDPHVWGFVGPELVMAEPTPGTEPEVGVQINAPSELDVCTWTDDIDEKRRAFVVSQMANCDVGGKIMVENMHAVCEWLKSGALPAEEPKLTLKGVRVV